MDKFWKAIRDREPGTEIDAEKKSPYSTYVFSRISENYRRAAASSTMPVRYRELQLLTDMVSGMTDSFAISLRSELERLDG
jgi:dGTPase